jgi:hypothetical protein
MQAALLQLQALAIEYDDAGVGPKAARARHRIASDKLKPLMKVYRGLFVVVCVARFNAAFKAEEQALLSEVPHPLARYRTIMGDRNSRSKRIYEQLIASFRWLRDDAQAHEARELGQTFIDVFAEVLDGRELITLQPAESG